MKLFEEAVPLMLKGVFCTFDKVKSYRISDRGVMECSLLNSDIWHITNHEISYLILQDWQRVPEKQYTFQEAARLLPCKFDKVGGDGTIHLAFQNKMFIKTKCYDEDIYFDIDLDDINAMWTKITDST